MEKTRRAPLGIYSSSHAASSSIHSYILQFSIFHASHSPFVTILRMLARAVQRQTTQTVRRISTGTPVKGLQHTATIGTTSSAASAAPAVSNGELAWCEIYGVDYDKQIQEALDDEPLLVSTPTANVQPLMNEHTSSSVLSTAGDLNAQGDIWNVVFGTSKNSA